MSKKLTMTIADVGYLLPDFQVIKVVGINCKLPNASTLKELKRQAVDLFSSSEEREFSSKSGGYRVVIQTPGYTYGQSRA